MEKNRDTIVSNFLRDAVIIIAASTALAYFAGNIHLNYYWRFIGLNCAIHPDYAMEEILLRGGVCVFLMAASASVAYSILLEFPEFKRKLENMKSYSSPIRKTLILLACLLLILIGSHLFAYTYAWRRSMHFQKEMTRVQELVLESGNSIPNTRELAFLGNMGSYLIFKRVDGNNRGEKIVISDSEIKLITIR